MIGLLILYSFAASVGGLSVAWAVLVVAFPGTDLDTAMGVLLLAWLLGFTVGVAVWWRQRARRQVGAQAIDPPAGT